MYVKLFDIYDDGIDRLSSGLMHYDSRLDEGRSVCVWVGNSLFLCAGLMTD